MFRITVVIWSTVEEGERHRQGQERSGDSSRQHRQRASHPHQTGETSCLFCLCLCVFDALALIKNKITHLTSIRARGSPGSSNQTIRRRRGKGFHCHSLLSLLILCSSTSWLTLPLSKLPPHLSFLFLSSLIGAAVSDAVVRSLNKQIRQLASANRSLLCRRRIVLLIS